MDAAAPQPAEPAVCPECGSPPTAVTPPGWTARHRRLVQTAAVLLGIVACVAWTWWTWPAPAAPTLYGPGVTSYEFPLERFMRADVRAYAQKERADGRLLDALSFRDEVSGAIAVNVAFVPPRASVTQFQKYGWPTDWLVYRWDATYTDCYARDAVVSQPNVRAARWLGPTHQALSIEPDGRRRARIIALRALVAPVVILFLTWQLGRLIGGLAARRPERKRTARRVGGVLFLIGAAGAIAALSLSPPVKVTNVWPMGPIATAPTTFSTGLTTGDVTALRKQVDGEATLARTVLEHAGSSSETDVLVIGAGADEQMRQSVAFAGWPHGLVIVSWVEPVRSNAREPVLRRVELVRGSAILHFVDAQTPAARRTVNVQIANVFEIVALLIVVWCVVGVLSHGLSGLRGRRERRRMARGLCARCGYQVGTAAPE